MGKNNWTRNILFKAIDVINQIALQQTRPLLLSDRVV